MKTEVKSVFPFDIVRQWLSNVGNHWDNQMVSSEKATVAGWCDKWQQLIEEFLEQYTFRRNVLHKWITDPESWVQLKYNIVFTEMAVL